MLDEKARKTAIQLAKKLAGQTDPENLKKAIVDPQKFESALSEPGRAKEELIKQISTQLGPISEEDVTPQKKKQIIDNEVDDMLVKVTNIFGFNSLALNLPLGGITLLMANLMSSASGITDEQSMKLWAATWLGSFAATFFGLLIGGAGPPDAKREGISRRDESKDTSKEKVSIKELKQLIREQLEKQKEKFILLETPENKKIENERE